MEKIVSGITATGKLTLGNYIGAIKNFVALQDQYDMNIFVADLHALTTDIEPELLRKNKKDIMALYVASGLNPEKVTLFYQSDVPTHAQMNWYMESRTTKGELERMTQFKDKSLKSKQENGTFKIKTTLLTYPALMAGDILLYNPTLVPVGNDQKQHLELARNIAERFNKQFGKTFNIPEPYIGKIGARIMSLQNPSKKMSKSDENHKATIFLLDNPEIAFDKIKKSVTDSENKVYYDTKNKPGISNLIEIYSALSQCSLEQTVLEFKDTDYGKFKEVVGTKVKDFLENLQNKYKEAIKHIDAIANIGATKANEESKKILSLVEEKLGIK